MSKVINITSGVQGCQAEYHTVYQGSQCFLITTVSGFKVMADKCNKRTIILI